MLHPSYSDLMAVANSEVEDGEQPVDNLYLNNLIM